MKLWAGICLCSLLFVDVTEAFGQGPLDFGPRTKHRGAKSSTCKRQRRGIKPHGAHSNKRIVSSVFSKSFRRPSSITTALRGGSVMASAAATPPALSAWIGPALLCALSYALYNLFIKKAATNQMDPILGGVLLQFVAASVGTLLWLFQRTTSSKAAIAPTRTAVAWAAAAGLAVGAAELLSFFISGMGVQAMQSLPIVVGGSVLMGTVLGSVWLKEVLTWKGWCGVVLISIGIALVGIDPGSSGGMH